MLRPQERFKVHYWEIWGRCLINKIELYNKLGFRWAIWSTDLVPNTTKNIKSMLVKSHIKYIVLKKTSSHFWILFSDIMFLWKPSSKSNVYVPVILSFNFPWLFFIISAYKRNRKSKQTLNHQDSPARQMMYHSELDSTAVHEYSGLSDLIKSQKGWRRQSLDPQMLSCFVEYF